MKTARARHSASAPPRRRNLQYDLYHASDHGGYRLKEISRHISPPRASTFWTAAVTVQESCDYPHLRQGGGCGRADGRCEKGIVICTTGIRVSITANKVNGIRCCPVQRPSLRGVDPPPQ